ncbi:MAG: hypothetical protein HXM80_08970 [Neisseria sicca]|jgi:hypothetical protein|uniref:Uncharacterized protein n=1 Tax=Neisseria sicca TaxID=490 RepID=A0A930DHX8_NEISI|nr:hypothetical protein [Neisseria sicca]
MANSNENTQNPKENQEKMADEGIQKHSEHTAANKQPESEDNVQNKNKPTRLCNFFKKLWNGDAQENNKNSKKAEENAPKNDDAAKQEEMKQAETVEQPKEQIKLSDYLEIISKSLGILAVLGMFAGGMYIYIYLFQTNQLSIFPDVMSNPYILVVISIYWGILLFLFTLFFFLAYQLGLNIKLKNKSSNRIEIIILIILIFPIILVFIAIFIRKFLYALLTAALTIFIAFIISLFVYIGIIDLKDGKIIFKFTLSASTFLTLLMILYSNHILILNSFHFIETPENLSWYLLHNNFQQNNGSQETNGIDKNDLLKLKQKFKCSILSEKEKAEKGITCSPETRNNALFGYMAWNLGDTKVFCPPTVNNTIGDEEQNEKLGKECIVISGKALQIMPESYISTNTDGIDDSNPDNTGHDDPATDINTDVRLKNDLNAQSNAGLNNFNVQPVLPIQSNAKNMSIQIHYGSCNHDSPRNKDGHPDIGYTDKKICQ